MLIYHDGGWSSGPSLPDQPTALSCSSSTSCYAFVEPTFDQGALSVYNGTSWSTPRPVDDGTIVGSLSCPSPTFCFAVSGNADPMLKYNGSRWTFAHTQGLYQVSCGSIDFCVQNADLSASVFDGTRWGKVVTFAKEGAAGGTDSLSCVGSDFCVLIGRKNGAFW